MTSSLTKSLLIKVSSIQVKFPYFSTTKVSKSDKIVRIPFYYSCQENTHIVGAGSFPQPLIEVLCQHNKACWHAWWLTRCARLTHHSHLYTSSFWPTQLPFCLLVFGDAMLIKTDKWNYTKENKQQLLVCLSLGLSCVQKPLFPLFLFESLWFLTILPLYAFRWLDPSDRPSRQYVYHALYTTLVNQISLSSF